jgi:uncharacterized protein (TIGR03435 family)
MATDLKLGSHLETIPDTGLDQSRFGGYRQQGHLSRAACARGGPCKPGVQKGGDSSPGRLRIGRALLADIDNTGLIQVAYNRYAGGHLNSFRVIPIEGGPDWIHSEAFEIDAKSEGHPKILMMMMQGPTMQAVLEDRFKA